MYYSLIPPIIAVLSIIGIIIFLMKKSSQVAEIVREDVESGKYLFPDRGFWGKIWHKIKSIKSEETKHFFLGIIERIARRSRIIFLKLESKFGEISNDIRAKRQLRVTKKIEENNKSEEKARDIFEKLKNYEVKDLKKEKAHLKIKKVYQEKEEDIRPMLSDKITVPEPKAEVKGKLEEALIERIAINPKDVEAYERLGEYYLEIKNYNDAKECFRQVLKLNPSNRNIKYKIRRLEYLLSK